MTELNSVKRKREILSGYLRKFSKCKFTKYDLSDYFPDNPFHVDNYNTRSILEGDYSARTQNTHIYVVKKGKSLKVPSQLASYQTGLFVRYPSYLFIRDDPSQITFAGRYFLAHEIGHASPSQAFVNMLSENSLKLLAAQLPWFVIHMSFNLFSSTLTILYVLSLIAVYPFLKSILSSQQFFNEINADIFAVRYFFDKDEHTLIEYFEKYDNLPQDPSLDVFQNAARYYNIQERIEEMKNASIKPVMIVFAKRLAYFLLPATLLIPLMGFYSRQPSVSLMCIIPLYAIILLGIAIWAGEKDSSLQKEIDQILKFENSTADAIED